MTAEATQARSVTVRRASIEDVDAIVAMGRQFLTTDYAHALIVDDTSLRTLAGKFASGATDVIGLVVRSETHDPIGMVGAFVYAHPLSGERTVSEMVWWVDPDWRGSSVGTRLLHGLEAWAADQGATRLEMIAPSDRVGAFYERLGFQRVETHYWKAL